MDISLLQHYWWLLIAILGGALVALSFVQGGQSLYFQITKTDEERSLLLSTIGRHWELTFTTLVTFGGAFFASFPLFYATSFGGAYGLWMLALVCYSVYAISYEFRKKGGNLLTARTYEIIMTVNGILGPLALGIVVASFFSGNPFTLTATRQVAWHGFMGFEALLKPTNLLLGLAVFLLTRILGGMYIIANVQNEDIAERVRKHIRIAVVPFLIFFLAFVGVVLFSQGVGYTVDESGFQTISKVDYKYASNLVEVPINTLFLLIGVVFVLWGFFRVIFQQKKAFYITALGTAITVICVFILAGYNNTCFYPSTQDINSSLNIVNASSSKYTLQAMSVVSLLIPVVIIYIAYIWKKLTKQPVSSEEVEKATISY